MLACFGISARVKNERYKMLVGVSAGKLLVELWGVGSLWPILAVIVPVKARKGTRDPGSPCLSLESDGVRVLLLALLA